MNSKKQGKKNRASGQRFELKVRKDLESKGWIVSKWMNNVSEVFEQDIGEYVRELIPAKHKFRGMGIPMAIGTGFPDFICFCQATFCKDKCKFQGQAKYVYSIIGVEVKSNGYLDKEEKFKLIPEFLMLKRINRIGQSGGPKVFLKMESDHIREYFIKQHENKK